MNSYYDLTLNKKNCFIVFKNGGAILFEDLLHLCRANSYSAKYK